MIDKLSLKTKIQLYILPLLIAYLIYYFYVSFFDKKEFLPSIKERIKIEKKEYKENNIELFFNIEKFAKNNKIDILKLSKKEKIVLINAKSSLSKTKRFIDFLENMNSFSKIVKIDLNKLENKNLYTYDIRVSLKNYYEKNFKKLENLQTNDNQFILSAIIADYTIINKKIVKLNDFIDGYKLTNIYKEKIKLEKDKDILILELFNDKFTKKIY